MSSDTVFNIHFQAFRSECNCFRLFEVPFQQCHSSAEHQTWQTYWFMVLLNFGLKTNSGPMFRFRGCSYPLCTVYGGLFPILLDCSLFNRAQLSTYPFSICASGLYVVMSASLIRWLASAVQLQHQSLWSECFGVGFTMNSRLCLWGNNPWTSCN